MNPDLLVRDIASVVVRRRRDRHAGNCRRWPGIHLVTAQRAQFCMDTRNVEHARDAADVFTALEFQRRSIVADPDAVVVLISRLNSVAEHQRGGARAAFVSRSLGDLPAARPEREFEMRAASAHLDGCRVSHRDFDLLARGIGGAVGGRGGDRHAGNRRRRSLALPDEMQFQTAGVQSDTGHIYLDKIVADCEPRIVDDSESAANTGSIDDSYTLEGRGNDRPPKRDR